ncbi:hypothetical protein OHB01_13335 [Microbispora hainanensis]|jgi:hypothetical protein|uniref:hypothetical protein n=1 Tax=Microbispora TaxID=2005 RepID=UPI0011CC3356|nr:MULTISPECIES: hypothetical protein [Microbispora]
MPADHGSRVSPAVRTSSPSPSCTCRTIATLRPFITAKNSVEVASAAGKPGSRNRLGSISGLRPRPARWRWCHPRAARTATPAARAVQTQAGHPAASPWMS